MNPKVYKCPLPCPLRKKCFILKTVTEIDSKLEVLVKCAANNKKDIRITIGGDKHPP